MKQLFASLYILSCSFFYAQDTTITWYGNPVYLSRNTVLFEELVFDLNPVDGKEHNYFNDGVYRFYDSLDTRIDRLTGTVYNHRKSGIWRYKYPNGNICYEVIYPSDSSSNLLIEIAYDSTGSLRKFSSHSINSDLDLVFSNFGISLYDEGLNSYYESDRNYVVSIDSNSIIRSEYWMKGTIRDGLYTQRNSNGSLYTKMDYNNGKKIGIWQYGLPNGTIWCQESYEDDLLYTIKFSSGKNYTITHSELEIIDFYPNGKVRLKGKTCNNRKIGKWEFFSEDGKLIGTSNHDSVGNCTGSTGNFGLIPFF